MEVWEREGSLFRKYNGHFQREKKLRSENVDYCGSPLIGINPPSRPSLRTHLMILVPDCTITKPKLFLIPEAEHCDLNYYGFLSMTVAGAKIYLVPECSVKNPYPIGWHIPYSPYMGVPLPRPRSCSKEWSAHIIGRLLCLAGKQNCTTPIS